MSEYIEKLSRIKKDIGLIQDSIYLELFKLEQENAKLKERSKEAENVIQFYAKPSVWGIASPSDMTSIDPCDVGDFFHQEIGITSRGGKKAREYLEKWGNDGN